MEAMNGHSQCIPCSSKTTSVPKHSLHTHTLLNHLHTCAHVHEKDFVNETGQLQAEYPNIKGDGTSLLCDTLGPPPHTSQWMLNRVETCVIK